jgi:hypothetical protein
MGLVGRTLVQQQGLSRSNEYPEAHTASPLGNEIHSILTQQMCSDLHLFVSQGRMTMGRQGHATTRQILQISNEALTLES